MIQKSHFAQLVTSVTFMHVDKYSRSNIFRHPGLIFPFKTFFFFSFPLDNKIPSSLASIQLHTQQTRFTLKFMACAILSLKRWIFDFLKSPLHNFVLLLCQLYLCFHFCFSISRGEGRGDVQYFMQCGCGQLFSLLLLSTKDLIKAFGGRKTPNPYPTKQTGMYINIHRQIFVSRQTPSQISLNEVFEARDDQTNQAHRKISVKYSVSRHFCALRDLGALRFDWL